MPFEIPESWVWCQVSDVFDLNPKNDVANETLSGFIPMASVEDGFGYSHSFEVRPWSEIKKGYSHFQNGDIGIAKISPCFENRKSTIFYNLPNGIGAGTTELTILRGHCVNSEFYLYLFQSAWYIFEGTKEFKGVVGQQRVNKEIFTTLQIPLPPLAEQDRIVTEVKLWFSMIALLDDDKAELITTIQQTKSKILDLAIHGKLVPQDPNDEPAIELLRRINPDFQPCDNAHYIMLPDGWSWCLLEDVANVLDSKRQPIKTEERKKRIQGKSITYPYYGATGIAGDIDDYIMEGRYILLGEDGAPFLDKNAPKAYEVTGRFWVNNHAHILEPQIDFLFLLHFLNAVDYAGYVKGTTRLKLTQSDMNRIKIMLPPLSEQQRIVAKIEELFATLDKIKESLEV